MIDITLYRYRIGSFNMTSMNYRFKKSRNDVNSLWSRNFSFKGTLSCLIVISSVVVIYMWKQTEELIVCGKSSKSKTSPRVLGSWDARLHHGWLIENLESVQAQSQFTLNNCGINLSGQTFIEINYFVKQEVKDHNFWARYSNGNGQKKKGILNMHLNIRSLKYKIHEIKNIVKEYGPHILGLSECELLKVNIDEKSLKIPGYDVLYPSSWSVDGFARILVFVKKGFKYKQIKEIQNNQVQSIWIQGGYCHSKNIMFGHVYREHLPNQNIAQQESYMSSLLSQWELATEYGNPSQPNETHICGDINIDMYKDKWLEPSYSLIHLSRLLKSTCDTYNFSQLVKSVTRVQYDSVAQKSNFSSIDHVYTNSKYKCSEAVVTPFGDSDHDIISYTRYSKIPPSPARIICKRNYRDFKRKEFLDDIKYIDWSEVYQCVDTDMAAACLTKKFNFVLDRHAPWVKIQQRKMFVPWLSNETKGLIKERDRWKSKAKSLAVANQITTNEQKEAWLNYKHFRNRINNRKKKEETLYKKEKMMEANASDSHLWRAAKNLMGWKSTGSPTKLSVDNKLITSAKDIAKSMNDFFVEKIADIRRSMSSIELDTSKIKHCMENKSCFLEFQHTEFTSVMKLLKGLSNSKSTSLDGLNNYSVKIAAPYIASPLHHVISLSLIQKKFPECWKYSKVVPLHKKGDPLDRKNYRPVALLSPLSKVLEKVIYKQMYSYFHENSLFDKSLHGYRRHRSTQTALLQLYDRLVRAASEGKLSGAVLLDLSAAFDLVDPEILLKKLKLYNVGNEALAWIKSYLTQRRQAVWVDHAFSDFLFSDVGVPQGSILGPLLFLIFFNDLPKFLSCQIEVYADDSTLSVSGTTIEEIGISLTENCAIVSKWMSGNKMKLNASKTHLMTLGTSRRLQGQNVKLSVEMNGQYLQESDSKVETLLGCVIEPSLKWHQQILGLVQKLRKRLAALDSLKFAIPYETRKRIAEAMFISVLTYCLPVYGGTDNRNIDSLQVMQNRAGRLVTLLPRWAARREIFDRLNWFTVRQLLFYHSALTTFRVRQSKEPEYLRRFMTRDNQRGNIVIPHTHLSLTKQSYCYRAAEEWNKIPQCIRKIDKIDKFKTELRIWIKDNVKQF